ncbi:hypothetical protein LXL04_030407 [Taraxacum kok-saghyz]
MGTEAKEGGGVDVLSGSDSDSHPSDEASSCSPEDELAGSLSDWAIVGRRELSLLTTTPLQPYEDMVFRKLKHDEDDYIEALDVLYLRSISSYRPIIGIESLRPI